jgi:NitT/TauT family transport system substrate-binding protein
MQMTQNRRRFLASLSMAGTVGLFRGAPPQAAESSLETTIVRISKDFAICEAPLDVADELLRAEGFTDIRYLDTSADEVFAAIARRKVDFALDFPVRFLPGIDAGEPITALAGIHVGCFELFAKDNARTIADLKRKAVGLKGSPPALLWLMAAQVGLDAANDIHWVTAPEPSIDPLNLFAEGKIDAFLGFPPEPQELRARHAGHVILSTMVDRPWSQYFCYMVLGSREYVRECPAATKRTLRAILKATDLCATDPTRAARRLVDGGFTPRYDYALQTLNDIPYNNWRDSMRGGHAPLLCTSDARGGAHQIYPQ